MKEVFGWKNYETNRIAQKIYSNKWLINTFIECAKVYVRNTSLTKEQITNDYIIEEMAKEIENIFRGFCFDNLSDFCQDIMLHTIETQVDFKSISKSFFQNYLTDTIKMEKM